MYPSDALPNIERVKKEVQKAVVGHEEIIDGILVCLFAGGHCLLDSGPWTRN